MAVSPALIARLRDLELIARRTIEGLRSGLHRSPFHGYSAEFSQYRHYRPGDDLKYVDWKLLARTDRVYSKQFRETTDLEALVVVDASASMAFGDPSKFEYARAAASVIAWLAADQGDAVGVLAAGGRVPIGLPPRVGRAHARAVLAALARTDVAGAASLAEHLARAAGRLSGRGILIVLSDFYDDEEATACAIRRASRRGHEVVLLQVVSREEIELPFAGQTELIDAESGAVLVTDPQDVRTRYREAFAAFLERWRTRAAAEGLDYALLITHTPLDEALRGWLVRRRRTR